jgi:hypothetical protein
MAVPIERLDAPVAALAPGQYTVQTASGRPAICCPGCGGIEELEAPIDARGAVAEAFKCVTPTCRFFDRVDLVAWDPS